MGHPVNNCIVRRRSIRAHFGIEWLYYLLRYLDAVLADGRQEDDGLLLVEQVCRHLAQRRHRPRLWEPRRSGNVHFEVGFIFGAFNVM